MPISLSPRPALSEQLQLVVAAADRVHDRLVPRHPHRGRLEMSSSRQIGAAPAGARFGTASRAAGHAGGL